MSAKDIDVIARWALHNAALKLMEDGWEHNLPDVGEYDYDQITERMTELLPPDVSFAEFETAYKVLACAAEKDYR